MNREDYFREIVAAAPELYCPANCDQDCQGIHASDLNTPMNLPNMRPRSQGPDHIYRDDEPIPGWEPQ